MNKGLLNYFLTRSLLLGGGISILFLYSGVDSYIAVFLGILLGIALLYIITLLSKNFSFKYLKIIYLIYILFLTFIILIILASFIYSYFLPFTPSIISCLPLIILAIYNSKNIKNLCYVASILFILSITVIILKTILLAPNYDLSNILPLMSSGSASIFKSAIIYAIISVSPYILLIDEGIDFKQTCKYYVIGSVTNLVVILSIALVMGSSASIYSYPEYSVLRKIRFLDFIENIENFISLIWFFDNFITLSLISLKLKKLFNTKSNIIPFVIITVIMFIVNNIIVNNFYNSIFIYQIFPLVFAILLSIIIIILVLKRLI